MNRSLAKSQREFSSRAEAAISPDALIAQARDGSATALASLVERLAEYLWAECNRRGRLRGLGPSHSLSDLVQETLVVAREKFSHFERDTFDDFKQWSRTILYRRWQQWSRNYRSRNREELKRNIQLAIAARMGAQTSSGRPDQAVEFRQEAARAEAAFALLKPHEQNIIKLRVLEELSYPQIETLTGVSAEAARTAFRRAIARLKQLFDGDAS